MNKTMIATAALLAATAAAAQVAPAAPGARDGGQTRTEVVERVRTMFARLDADRDGAITQAEVQALRGQGQARRMTRKADPARRAQAFDRLDANRDNMISRDEWARAEAMRGQRQAARGEGAPGAGQRMAMRGRMGGAMLRQADTNNDQRITLQEAESAALQRFDRADADRDGRITVEERQQLRQRLQQGRN